MIQYLDWVGRKDGVKSHRHKHDDGFNNIRHSTELCVARMITTELNTGDLQLFRSHIDQTQDDDGLYSPKQSRDNLIMKAIGGKHFYPEVLKEMSVMRAIKGKRIQDKILLTFMCGNMWQRLLVRPVLWLASLGILYSINSKGKLRPNFFESIKDFACQVGYSLGILRPKHTEVVHGGHVYTLAFNYKFRLLQNDGKVMYTYLLHAFSDESWTLRLTRKIAREILLSKFGFNYMSAMSANYYEERDHPVTTTWRRVEIDGIDLLRDLKWV